MRAFSIVLATILLINPANAEHSQGCNGQIVPIFDNFEFLSARLLGNFTANASVRRICGINGRSPDAQIPSIHSFVLLKMLRSQS